jgi:hypothetical protein
MIEAISSEEENPLEADLKADRLSKKSFMVLSEISKLLNKEITLDGFKERIKKEISEYKRSLDKKGSSSPIFLNEDLQDLVIGEIDIKFLCEAYLQNKLDKWELNYIAEALLLSDKIIFKNGKVEEVLLALTDSEYFELISTEFVKSILEDLNS